MPTFPRPSLSFRTAGFPQYGWKAGFPSGAFPDHQRLKPAPGIRRPSSSLHPPFVHLVATTVVPHCVGPRTRLRTALEGYYSSTPGVLARVRVIVSRSVITYSTPSVPLVGAPRLARRGISRFPSQGLLHMPGSSTTPGRSDLAMVRPKRVAFRARNSVGTRGLALSR